MRPTKASTTASAARPSSARAASRSPGRNRSRSTPGGMVTVRLRVGAVQLDELAGLLLGVADQPVGLGHHLVLADHPDHRLRGVALGQRGVLDPGQGVRAVHQRHPPAVPGQPADLPGQPVVRVHDPVVAGLVPGLGPQHAGGERAQLAGQVVLAQALERAGGDVPHQHARRQLGDRRLLRRGGPGEDLHRNAAPGHPGRRLHDVDVHAAGVAGARLLQRGGVHGQHADPPGTQRRAVAELHHGSCVARNPGAAPVSDLASTPSSARNGSSACQRPSSSTPGGHAEPAVRPAADAAPTARRAGAAARRARRPRAAGRPPPPRPPRPRPPAARVLDGGRDHLGGQRQVQQLGQRDRVAADHQLARGQHARPATGRPAPRPRRRSPPARPWPGPAPGGRGRRRRTRPAATASASADVRRDDQRRAGLAVRVGEPGQQVGGGPGVGHGEVGAHPDRGQERLVDADLRHRVEEGGQLTPPTAAGSGRAGARRGGRAGPATRRCSRRSMAAARVSRSAASRASAAGQAVSSTRSRSRTATSRVGGSAQAVPPALLVVQVVVGPDRLLVDDHGEPVEHPDRGEHLAGGSGRPSRGRSTPTGASAASSGRSAASGSISSSARAGLAVGVGQGERAEPSAGAAHPRRAARARPRPAAPGPARPRRRPPTGRRPRQAPGAPAAPPGRRVPAPRRREQRVHGVGVGDVQAGNGEPGRRAALSAEPGRWRQQHGGRAGHQRPSDSGTGSARSSSTQPGHRVGHRPAPRTAPATSRRPLDPEQPLDQLRRGDPMHTQLRQRDRDGRAGRRASSKPAAASRPGRRGPRPGMSSHSARPGASSRTAPGRPR